MKTERQITDHAFTPDPRIPGGCGYRKPPEVIHNPCRFESEAHRIVPIVDAQEQGT